MFFRTEHEFTLPLGFIDADGNLHRDGVMRLATAADEVLPLREATVQRNPAYLTMIVLARVVTRLGTLSLVTPNTIERLFAVDVSYLQDLYNELNSPDLPTGIAATCPSCNHEFEVERAAVGGS